MLVAVKWRTDFELWPEKVIKNIKELPEGFDILMSLEDYNLHLSSHQQDFIDWKAAEASSQAAASEVANGIAKFQLIRNKWTQLADKFAFENTVLGITQIPGKTKEVADAFERVVYYLNSNAPTEAIKELDLIPRGETFLTEQRITALKNEFAAFLSTI